MPVYVDPAVNPFGRMMMCHMWADTDAELLAMADKIGVARKWIQGHQTLSFGKHRAASWVHFDIAKGKRAMAVVAGAIETDRYGAVLHTARLLGNAKMIETVERLRARRRGETNIEDIYQINAEAEALES